MSRLNNDVTVNFSNRVTYYAESFGIERFRHPSLPFKKLKGFKAIVNKTGEEVEMPSIHGALKCVVFAMKDYLQVGDTVTIKFDERVLPDGISVEKIIGIREGGEVYYINDMPEVRHPDELEGIILGAV